MIGDLLMFQIQNFSFKFTIVSDDEVALGYNELPCCDEELGYYVTISFPTSIIDENNTEYNFRSVKKNAFLFIYGNKFIFPKSIEKIEESSFKNFMANTLDLSATSIIEIPSNAFEDSLTTNIFLPECVESIGDYAFRGSLIFNFTAPSQLKMLGTGIFDDIFFLDLVDLSRSQLISIPDRIFAGSGAKIILPDTIIFIGKESFSHSINIPEKFPKSLQILEEKAFQNVANNNNIVINFKNTNLRVIGPHAFSGNSRITSIIIPNTVEEIAESAFDGVPLGLTDFSQMIKLKILGPRCYAGTWVKTVNLSISPIKEIGDGAFDDSPNLDEIILPPSIETINPMVRNCPKLINIQIPKSIKYIMDFGFSNLTSVTKLFLSHLQINTIPSNCFSNCPNLSIITLPPTTVSISSDAFTNLPSLKRIFACGPKLDYQRIPVGVTLYTSEKWNIPEGAKQIVTSDCARTDPETLKVYGVSKPNVLLYLVISVSVVVFLSLSIMLILFMRKAKIQTVEEVSDDPEDEGQSSKRKNRRVVLTRVPKQPHYLATSASRSSFGKRLMSSSSSLSNIRG